MAQDEISGRADPAGRAGAVVTDHVRSIIDAAQGRAAEIERSAQEEILEIRTQAYEAANRVLERMDSIEDRLGNLVRELRGEVSSYRDRPRTTELVTKSGPGNKSMEDVGTSLPDLAAAADPAGSLVWEQIASMTEAARAIARDIERRASRASVNARREAVDEVERVADRISAIERELGLLLLSVLQEADGLRGKLHGAQLRSAPAFETHTSLALEPPDASKETTSSARAGNIEADVVAEPESTEQSEAVEDLTAEAKPAAVQEEAPTTTVARAEPAGAVDDSKDTTSSARAGNIETEVVAEPESTEQTEAVQEEQPTTTEAQAEPAGAVEDSRDMTSSARASDPVPFARRRGRLTRQRRR